MFTDQEIAALGDAKREAFKRLQAARDLEGAVWARAQEMQQGGREPEAVQALRDLVAPLIQYAEASEREAVEAYNVACDERLRGMAKGRWQPAFKTY